jgi:hypothetical protein
MSTQVAIAGAMSVCLPWRLPRSLDWFQLISRTASSASAQLLITIHGGAILTWEKLDQAITETLSLL